MRSLLTMLLLTLPVSPALLGQSVSPYDERALQLQSHWNTATEPEQLVLLSRLIALKPLLTQPERIQKFISSIAVGETAAGSQRVRNEASAAIAQRTNASQTVKHWYEDEQSRSAVLAIAEDKAHTGGAADLETLAELEYMSSVPAAEQHMEAAALQSRDAALWARAAAFASDSLTRFTLLSEGLKLEPANPRICIPLADYYIGRQQLEKARDLLQQAAQAAPGDFVVRERLADVYLHLGLRSATLSLLRDLEKEAPQTVWLRLRLAEHYEELGMLDSSAALANSVLAQDPGESKALELLVRIDERRHNVRDLESEYARLAAVEPQSAVWRKLGELEIEAGRPGAGRAALEKAAALDPSMGAELASMHKLPGVRDARREGSVSHVPDSATAEEAVVSGLLEDADSIAKTAFLHPPKSADVVLADVEVQELLSGGLHRTHIQQIFYAGSDAAVERRRIMSVRYSPEQESLRIVHARLRKPDGRVIYAQDLGDQMERESQTATYYGVSSRELRFGRLEKGDVVELEYVLAPTQKENGLGTYFGELVLFSGTVETSLKRYALVTPENATAFAHAELLSDPKEQIAGGRRIRTWEARGIPALTIEPHGPGATELSPYVHVSTFGDWQQLGAWYAGLIRPQFQLTPEMQRELQDHLKGLRTDQQKIMAIHEWVVRSTHYIAQEFGVYSYKPYPVSQVYARRYGDCKDKASLMVALLQAAGINAEVALVRTRSLGEVAVAPASMAIFDHAIVYIPAYELWLDGTAEYSGRELPVEDQGALALTVALDGTAQLRRVGASSAAENSTRRTIRAELDGHGVLTFAGTTVTRGQDAPVLRHDLAEPGQQLDLYSKNLAEAIPGAQISSIAVHGTTSLESDVSIDFQGALSYQGKSTVLLSTSWMPRNYVSALAAGSSRSQDLLLPASWTTEEEIHIALPPGAHVKSLPSPQKIGSAFGSMDLSYRKSGSDISIESHVEFDRTRISATDYAAFRAFCSSLERAFHAEISVELPR